MTAPRRSLWSRIRQIWITLGLAATAVFVVWSLIAYRANAEGQAAAISDATVAVTVSDGVSHFASLTPVADSTPVLIFFPGALVDARAYAPLLRQVASAGFEGYLVELPRRGAFGGATDPAVGERVNRVLQQLPPGRRWVMAGHSRGAVVASTIAATLLSPAALQEQPGFAGLVLIGSSHPRDVDLHTLTVPVAKIVGTRDGLASRDEVEANRALVPATTTWVWVEGGNHSQFGWYGFQPGDRRATIAAAQQREIMVRGVLDVMQRAAVR